MLTRINGYAALTERATGNVIAECDTFQCNHCQRITHVKVKQRAEDLGGFCAACSNLICSGCVGKPCDVIERKLERVERANDMRRWFLECT